MSAHLSIEISPLGDAAAHIVLVDDRLNTASGTSDEGAQVKKIAAAASFEGKSGQSYLYVQDGAPSLLLLGVGSAIQTSLEAELAGAALYKALRSAKTTSANLTDIALSDDFLAAFLYGALSQSYEFNSYFTKKEESTLIELGVAHPDQEGFATHMAEVHAMLAGVFMARDLITEPANVRIRSFFLIS